MASFKDLAFTSAEFARLAQISKNQVDEFEKEGVLTTIRKKVGNVDRKMVPLESAQSFFSKLREMNVPSVAAATETPNEAGDPSLAAGSDSSEVAMNASTGRHGDQKAPIGMFLPKSVQHKVQMFYNVKGGTGKSTLTAQFIMQAALMGYRVLGIDLDGQGHLSLNLDVLNAHELPTIYDVLINDLPMKDSIINVAPGLDLVPANLGLCTIEIPLNQKPRREYRLGEAIRSVYDQYDLIVADTNPAASILNSSMLVAADQVNVVCATNPLSFHGMSLVMATIEEMEREFRKELAIKIIPNMYDNREVISQEVLGELKSQFGDYCARSVISRSVDLNEATKQRTSVWGVNSRGIGAQDIGALANELIAQGQAELGSASLGNA
ncbi:MAG TPA: ParA family protein [Oligoflexia bacterium]|nr:ParA family protein [Oligoflexia bacterium]